MNILQRSPDPGGLQLLDKRHHQRRLDTRGRRQRHRCLARGPDVDGSHHSHVHRAGRAPDQAGLAGWVHAYEGGDPMSAIGLAFISSPEGNL